MGSPETEMGDWSRGGAAERGQDDSVEGLKHTVSAYK